LGRLYVMSAPRGVDVVIAGPPAQLRWINPPLQTKFQRLRLATHGHLFGLRQILRAARVFDGVRTGWKFHFFAVGAIDLRLKTKVGREAFGRWRIDAPFLVADDKAGDGGLIVFIPDLKA